VPCFSPLKGWRSIERTKLGKRSIVFNPRFGLTDMPVAVPCGQCIGCRLERSRQWAVRCLHEASLHERNCFITLTFSDEYYPRDGSLNVAVFQKFMKRLRKRFGNGIRFFACGEYGENFGRPHYHACLFNFDFPDRLLWSHRDGVDLYTSAALCELWPFGFSSVGDVTFESAAYVARYIMKKVTGSSSSDHYDWVDPLTGQVFSRVPEFTTMSRRPGIAHAWIGQFLTDVYPSDFLVVNGVKCKPPRFYDKFYALLQKRDSELNSALRVRKAKLHACDQSDKRLLVRREVCSSRVERLARPLT